MHRPLLHVGPDQKPAEAVAEWSEYVVDLAAALISTLWQLAQFAATASAASGPYEEQRLQAQLRRIQGDLSLRLPIFAEVLTWAVSVGWR